MSLAEETLGPTVKFSGTCFVCRVCAGEAQEEHLSEVVHEFGHVDDSGMTMAIEQVVAQLQQEVFTSKAQVADQSGVAQSRDSSR